MKRRHILQAMIAAGALPLVGAISNGSAARAAMSATGKLLMKTSAEWKELLEPARYRVLFEEATEAPNSSPLNMEKREGTFICAACNQPLFESAHKFDSGTGWPSFTQPIEGNMGTKRDFRMILPRTEYHCSRCEGHQGHVFKDGPRPRGERWCNNGLALEFVPKDETLPELRT